MEAQIIKYAMRWRQKNGVEDLEKAKHFIDKLIEVQLKELNGDDVDGSIYTEVEKKRRTIGGTDPRGGEPPIPPKCPRCQMYLKDGVCPQHGEIRLEESAG